MVRKETFERSLDILISAWERGELMHGNCTACAVGNLCGGDSSWEIAFYTAWCDDRMQYKMWHNLTERGESILQDAIKQTGYSVEELARIEFAFESSLGDNYLQLCDTEEGQYIGLCAVIDVLTDIHQVEAREPRKRLDSVAVGKGLEVQTTQL